MEFQILDKSTRNEFSWKIIEDFARENKLMEYDIDQFAITEDGHIVLLDDCGNFAYWYKDSIVKLKVEAEI